MRSRKLTALAAASAFLLQPQLATAQANCITEDEMSALAVYAVPGAVQAMRLTCGSQLSTNGWLAREGASFASRYSGLQNGLWPKAKSGLLKFATDKAAGQGVDPKAAQMLTLVADLPDANVRPVVDTLLVQEISARIQPKDCGKVERVMEAIAPIEPQTAASLIAALASFGAEQDAMICKGNAS